MAYIDYSQDSVGGAQVAEAMALMQEVYAKMKNLAAWIDQIGPSGLESNSDFSVGTGEGQAFNDTFLQIVADLDTFMGDGSGGTNAEKIARLARGS